MGKLFGKKKRQGQSNGGGGAAGGGTGTEAAALRGPKRGLGSRIQDGWDRFKYWAGGGGAAVNNKTRNWLADGKEGSWRRNKAERLADREYSDGMDYIQWQLKHENQKNLAGLLKNGEIGIATYNRARKNNISSENALRAEEFGANMKAAGKERGLWENELEMLGAMEDFTSTMMTEHGAYANALLAGNGSVQRGELKERSKQNYIGSHPEYFSMTKEEKEKALDQNYQSELRYHKMSEDKVAIGDKYKGLLMGRNESSKQSEYANRMERHERGVKKLQDLDAMLNG